MKNYGHSPEIDQTVDAVHAFMMVLAPALVLKVPDDQFAEITVKFSKELVAQLELVRREALQAPPTFH